MQNWDREWTNAVFIYWKEPLKPFLFINVLFYVNYVAYTETRTFGISSLQKLQQRAHITTSFTNHIH